MPRTGVISLFSTFWRPWYHRTMIIDGISVTELSEYPTVAERALASFLKFIEKKLNVSIVQDARTTPSDRSLFEPLRLAAKLQENGIVKNFGRAATPFTDEPRTKSWYATCNDSTSHGVGGTTWENDADALYAALAEGLERYIWFTQDDYFLSPTKTSVEGIQKKGPCIRPEEFAGFSEAQRSISAERELRSDAEYLWITGISLVKGVPTYLPAQIVSRARKLHESRSEEPFIRQTTTNGLATWPTQSGARLAGALELIEREAYMIMWLNQLTLPRISLPSLCARHPELARSVEICERYRLKIHVVKLITDAPTHAVAVVIEDLSDAIPRFTIGLRAHRSLSTAIQKATTEALRARRFCRTWFNEGNVWDMSTPIQSIGHRDRLYYWAMPEHTRQLEFLIQGKEIEVSVERWDNDDEEQHLQRILEWCREKNLECISVSLGTSSKNLTPWYIEMVVMPQLQPTYLQESLQAFGGTRWRDVPKALGYTPLKKPFADRPHPFS
ncbi:MAG: biosynthesis docking protein, SagD family [Parcubacteria group bacterium Athens0416_74]|nr:MAG: biosynthesis docking protein, SagD family [Parcubacteria group bacterium Athens0416_74]